MEAGACSGAAVAAAKIFAELGLFSSWCSKLLCAEELVCVYCSRLQPG